MAARACPSANRCLPDSLPREPLMNRLVIAAAMAAAMAACSSAVAAQGVTVTLSEFKLGISKDTVKAGPVSFQVSNTGVMSHAFYVRGPGVDKGTRDLASKEGATLTVTLKAGTYDVFCPMSDGSHKAAGMAHALVVLPAAAPAPAKKKPGV